MRSTQAKWAATFIASWMLASPALAGSVSAVKNRLSQAKELQEAERSEDAEEKIKDAEKFLDGLTDDEKAPLLADIKTLRGKLAGALTGEQKRNIIAAKNSLNRAKSQIESKQISGIDSTFKTAEKYLADVPDTAAGKADLLKQIADLRKQAGVASEPVAPKPEIETPAKVDGSKSTVPKSGTAEDVAPKTESPKSAPDAGKSAAEMTSEQQAAFSKARGLVRQAQTLSETKRTENVPGILDNAEAFLPDLPEAQRIDLAVQIAVIRKSARDVDNAEEVRRIDSEIHRQINAAEQDITVNAYRSADAIQAATQRIAEPDAQQYVSPAQIKQYEAQLSAIKKKLAATNKADALGRAEDLIKQIEETLAGDAFKGKIQPEVYSIQNSLEGKRKGALAWIENVPPDDADAIALRARIRNADRQISKAEAAWGKSQLDAQVGGSWDVIKKDIEGWDKEAIDPKSQKLEEPNLPKTRTAISRIGYWLNSDETKKTRAGNKSDPKLDATFIEAEKIFNAAAEKMAAAYEAVFATANKMETPMRRFDLDRPNLLAVSAEYSMAGTKQQADVIAHARKLDEKWKAEVAAIMKSRQELYDKLEAEGEIKWPAIVAKINPQPGLLPSDPAAVGKPVLLKDVYNRTGWDFSGLSDAIDFSFRLENGTPVGGAYEPQVLKALEHVWYELKLDVNDRIPWDVIAIVEGPAKIGQRTTITLRDANTSLEVGKLEEYRPVESIRIRIIALHAGPVAVGPAK